MQRAFKMANGNGVLRQGTDEIPKIAASLDAARIAELDRATQLVRSGKLNRRMRRVLKHIEANS